jgi:hypothetical protein
LPCSKDLLLLPAGGENDGDNSPPIDVHWWRGSTTRGCAAPPSGRCTRYCLLRGCRRYRHLHPTHCASTFGPLPPSCLHLGLGEDVVEGGRRWRPPPRPPGSVWGEVGEETDEGERERGETGETREREKCEEAGQCRGADARRWGERTRGHGFN